MGMWISYEDYLGHVQAVSHSGNAKHLRIGQIYFNTLSYFRPDLAERVRATEIDPFHRDLRVDAFLTFVHDNW